jgi:hypothetical protein
MKTILKGAYPRMENAEESRKIASHVLRVRGELLYGPGRCADSGRIGDVLVAPDEAAQILWNREREHEMMTGQLPAHLGFEPLPRLVVLACGTMAIPA